MFMLNGEASVALGNGENSVYVSRMNADDDAVPAPRPTTSHASGETGSAAEKQAEAAASESRHLAVATGEQRPEAPHDAGKTSVAQGLSRRFAALRMEHMLASARLRTVSA